MQIMIKILLIMANKFVAAFNSFFFLKEIYISRYNILAIALPFGQLWFKWLTFICSPCMKWGKSKYRSTTLSVILFLLCADSVFFHSNKISILVVVKIYSGLFGGKRWSLSLKLTPMYYSPCSSFFHYQLRIRIIIWIIVMHPTSNIC